MSARPEASHRIPETPAQATEFDRRKRNYVRAGLCQGCAAQAAYGHQLGFAQVHPPCPPCVEIVAEFPVEAWGAWRKYPRGRLPGSFTRSSTLREGTASPAFRTTHTVEVAP